MTRHPWSILAAGTTLLAVLGGCGGGPEPLPRGGLSSTTSGATVSEADTDKAVQAAKGRLAGYIDALDTAMQSPQRYGAESLMKQADPVGSKASMYLNTLRRGGLHQTGRTKLKAVTVRRTALVATTDDQGTKIPPTVVLDACLDLSGVRFVDRSGKADSMRSDTELYTYTLTNLEYPKDEAWKVTYASSEKKPC